MHFLVIKRQAAASNMDAKRRFCVLEKGWKNRKAAVPG
jgi:hypothetical protein